MPRVKPPSPVVAEFGARLRAHRTAAGLSQMELAERAGMHFTFVSSVERGLRNPTLTTILSLAEGLGINPAVLLDGLRRH